MTSDLEEHLEEMMVIGLMTLEEVNGYWRQDWEEFVESGEMNREQADGFLEGMMMMRVAEAPYAPSPSTFDPEETHTGLGERVHALSKRASKGQGPDKQVEERSQTAGDL